MLHRIPKVPQPVCPMRVPFMTSSRRDRLYRIGGLRHQSVASSRVAGGALCGLAMRDACVHGCRWPYNERQGRLDTVTGPNGAVPVFMRRDTVVS